jgi:hypothetical protein
MSEKSIKKREAALDAKLGSIPGLAWAPKAVADFGRGPAGFFSGAFV